MAELMGKVFPGVLFLAVIVLYYVSRRGGSNADNSEQRLESIEGGLKSIVDIELPSKAAQTQFVVLRDQVNTLAEHFNTPATFFGTIWITIVAERSVETDGSSFTYECNCLNVGGMPCQVKKVVVHLDHDSFEQNAEDALVDQALVITAPLRKFERVGRINVPNVSTDKLRQVRFENARLIDDSGKTHYVDVRLSGDTILAEHYRLRRDIPGFACYLADIATLIGEAETLRNGLAEIKRQHPAVIEPILSAWNISLQCHRNRCTFFASLYGLNGTSLASDLTLVDKLDTKDDADSAIIKLRNHHAKIVGLRQNYAATFAGVADSEASSPIDHT